MRFIDRKRHREKRLLAKQLRQDSTPEERILWHQLRTNKLLSKHFRRQHVLAGFVVDFYCHSSRLVVELDGDHHLLQQEADQMRDAVLTGLGNAVIRFRNSEIRDDLKGVLRKIEVELKKQVPDGVPPSPFRGRGSGG